MKCCMGSQESCTNGHVAIQENDGFTAGVSQSFISRSRSSLVLLEVDEREWPTTAESGQVICIVVGRPIVDDDDLMVGDGLRQLGEHAGQGFSLVECGHHDGGAHTATVSE